MNLEEILLDVRDLEHPEPMQKAMKIIQSLDNQHYLHMIHRKNPLPLIDLAKENQFQVFSKEDKHSIWHILISKDTNINLDELLDV